MKPVCVLGNGQLGRMLRQAGEPLGIAVYPVGLDAEPQALPIQQSVITAEIERWPETALTRELASHSAFVNRDIFPLLADRLTQKQLLDRLGLATAPWQLLENTSQWPQVFASLGELAIVKRRTGGYDGRGQWRLHVNETETLPADCYGECIVEQGIHFSGEVSLVGARAHDGRTVFYPLTHNLHQDGILRTSVALPEPDSARQRQAEKMLSAIMHELNYVGVMAMECFIVPEGLLINELAPRVHNSGHWTQNGASISQFELHLRAILDLPMPKPVVSSPAVMINLIGTAVNLQWLAQPLVNLHWYEKEVRPGRKVGHLNLCDPSADAITRTLDALATTLPAEYHHGLQWAQARLQEEMINKSA
ncbi:5-(carboxyamino)imidazole ribonucleotide synthase [Erwinia sp. 9145]|uniref:5-(carboxyamino)imidazole ribonucleotide synthase n=1 Tax=Erwinia sp. 9145 TaxID=1500895 RepID=UPI00054F9240|nr:5-(carboxyamino)imidazole ribonucleotide synthase [Erwinia sp. 9145]